MGRCLTGESLRIVKKTLKGNLLGKTGYKSVKPGKAPREDSEADKPTRLKPRTQATLDALVKDDDVVVLSEHLRPSQGKAIPVRRSEEERAVKAAAKAPKQQSTLESDPDADRIAKEAAADVQRASAGTREGGATSKRMEDRSTSEWARRVLGDALMRRIGRPGTQLEGTHMSFEIAPERGHGVVRAPHTVLAPLPDGHALPHEADICIELDNGALLVLDIASSGQSMAELKARAYDAAQMLRMAQCFSVQVFVRSDAGGVSQEMAEALGHDYDHHFSIREEDVLQEAKFAALIARIEGWLSAAGVSGGRT